MARIVKWYHSLRVRISLVIVLIVLILEVSGALSLYYFDRLNQAVQTQATQKLPTLEVLSNTQLGITKLANLSGAMSRSESPAHSRILMSQVEQQILDIQKGLGRLGTDEQAKALKQVIASVEPSMQKISHSKARLDQVESQLREKLAQAIRLTTGAIVGAEGSSQDVAKLNVLLINLSQLLTVETLYEQNRIVDNIHDTVGFFAQEEPPVHVYLQSVLVGNDGVVEALKLREQHRSEVVGLDTQNRILLGNVVDFGQRVYSQMEQEVAQQSETTSEQATLFSEMLLGVLILQLAIAALLILFLHKQLFKRLQQLQHVVGRQQSITDLDMGDFDERNEVGLLVHQLHNYLRTIHQQKQQIATTSQQLQMVIKHSHMKTAVITGDQLLYCSEPLKQVFSSSQLQTVQDFPEKLADQMLAADAGQLDQLQEIYFDGTHQRWYDVLRDTIYWNSHQASLFSFIDITERIQAAQEYEKTIFEVESEAYVDPLTRLFNRKMFDRQVALYNDEGSQKTKMAVLLFDVDHFKGYNDCLGHLEGDKVLKKVASVIQRNTPVNGLAIRYGGEEFLILLPTEDEQMAVNVAQTIVEDVFSQEISHPTSPHTFLSISCGVSLSKNDADSLLNIFDQADKSLYKAKNSGRNCVLIHRQAA